MQADVELSGRSPSLVVKKDGSQIVIRCEKVDHLPDGPRASGKYIHLGMTAADAMLLLAQLKEAQRRQVLLDPGVRPAMITIPSEKDRN